MKQIYKVSQGVIDFHDSIVIEDDAEMPEGYTSINTNEANTEGTPLKYKPDGTIMTQAEIDAIHNAPTLPSLQEQLKNLQQAFNEFILGG